MNFPSKDRERVRVAARHLVIERQRFDEVASNFRVGFDRYRPMILIGGGFAVGFVLGRKRFLEATRSVLSIANLGAALMSSSLGSMLVAATMRKSRPSDSAAKHAKPAVHS